MPRWSFGFCGADRRSEPDWQYLAECDRGGAVRVASVARGVGRMGRGTQRHARDLFRTALADRVRASGRVTLAETIRAGRCDSRAWSHGQTDARDLALCHAVTRLLVFRRYQRSEVRSQWSVVRGLVVEKLPLFALVALSSVITYIAQAHGGAVRTFTAAPIWVRLTNVLLAYARYLCRTFWPHDLALDDPYPRLFNVWHLIHAATVTRDYGCSVSGKGNEADLIVGWLWFVGTLVPVIGIVQVGEQAMADRYHYIPIDRAVHRSRLWLRRSRRWPAISFQGCRRPWRARRFSCPRGVNLPANSTLARHLYAFRTHAADRAAGKRAYRIQSLSASPGLKSANTTKR